jgi:hypothetical protein
MKVLLTLVSMLFITNVFAQNLNSQRIWKISSKKRSIFLDKGIFHSDSEVKNVQLSGVRNSYVTSRGYERVVFDFNTSNTPRIYGHISKKDKKIYLDFFNTSLNKALTSIKEVKYVKSVDFYNIDKNQLSVELSFNSTVSFDIFFLENPGRLVIDVKK